MGWLTFRCRMLRACPVPPWWPRLCSPSLVSNAAAGAGRRSTGISCKRAQTSSCLRRRPPPVRRPLALPVAGHWCVHWQRACFWRCLPATRAAASPPGSSEMRPCGFECWGISFRTGGAALLPGRSPTETPSRSPPEPFLTGAETPGRAATKNRESAHVLRLVYLLNNDKICNEQKGGDPF